MNMFSSKKLVPVFFFFIFRLPVASGQPEYKDFFELKTLRFDCYLAGNAEHQHIYVNGFREEPLWGGPLTHLTDHPEYGEYSYRIYDEASGKLIYQRGFNSLFQEWRTTDEAKITSRAYSQVILFPYPKNKIRLEILERNAQTGSFAPLFETTIDPNSVYINREKRASYPVTPILNNGECARKVDLVFVAEGYTKEEMDKFKKDVIRFSGYLFKTPPYSTRKKDFNIWAVECPSGESGVDVPKENIWKNTTLNAHFDTFGTDRYLTAPDLSAIRDRIWNVSCDAVYVMVNSEVYGGGGIYNYYGISTSGHALSESVFVHEFGHSFAGLADEYFSTEVAYNDFYHLKNEPWEPNITTLVDFGAKWKDLLPPGIQIPTPDIEENEHQPGVYEGGGYLSKGIYRPMINCRMRTHHAAFCPVCQKAINQMIDLTIDP